ncbi:hypothetical protein [Metabacillus sp. SLBN-84]
MSDILKKIKDICILQEQDEISEQWAMHRIGKIMKHDDVIREEIQELKRDFDLVEKPLSRKILADAILRREQKLDEYHAFHAKNKTRVSHDL